MRKIILNNEEFAYLSSQANFKSNFIELVEKIEKINTLKYVLITSDNNTDLLRDQFGEQLQLFGFDEKYELTKEGEILETLIDKFFF
jgi:hypothetical protein